MDDVHDPTHSPDDEVDSDHEHDPGVPARSVGRDDGRPPETPGDAESGSTLEHREHRLDKREQDPLAGRDDAVIKIADQEPLFPLSYEQRLLVESTSGNIPPPTMLQSYGEVNPTFPERILAMAEFDQRWRAEAARKMVDGEVFAVRIGALTLPLVSIMTLVLAGFALLSGGPWYTSLIVGSIPGILTALGHFVGQVRNSSPVRSPDEQRPVEREEGESPV